MTMTDRSLTVVIKVRQGYGRQWGVDLKLDDPDVLEGIIERAAGRSGGAGWEYARTWLWMAMQNALLEWAQRERPGEVQAARNHVDVLAAMLGRPWRCTTCDDPACCGHPPHPLDSGDSSP